MADRSAADARVQASQRRDAERWLGYAESDAAGGKVNTNAMRKAIDLGKDLPDLRERLLAVGAQNRANQAALPRKDAERWLAYAESDAADGATGSNAITLARQMAGQIPDLGDRLSALEATITTNLSRPRPGRTMLRTAPICGRVTRLGSALVVYTRVLRSQRISEDDPSIYGAHLLGYEGDMGALVEYRPATTEEVAAFEAAQDQARARADELRQLVDARDQLARRIRETGQIPAGRHHLTGEQLGGGPTLHGGGEWFVVDDAGIWYPPNRQVK